MRIKFTIGDSEILAELNEGPTAKKIAASLPINGAGNYWGEEFYFSVPVQSVYEPGASDVVEPGTVAFWVEGSCLCLFWGPTPVSRGRECRAASKVNVVGKVLDPAGLRSLKARTVKVKRLETAG
jgi:hypothetical protein